MANEDVKRWVLAGTDYVYPRTTNKILEAYLKAKGVAAEDIMINYTPFGHSDWQTIVVRHQEVRLGRQEDRRRLDDQRRRQRALLQGARQPGHQGDRHSRSSPSRSARKSSPASTPSRCVGHLAAWNYFQSIDTPENKAFIEKWKAFTKNPKRTTNDPMEAHVIGFNMWVKAVEKAGTTDPDAVIDALIGVSVPNLTGGYRDHDAEPPHHQAGADRRDPGGRPVRHRLGRPRAWSSATSGRTTSSSKDLISDWREPMACGNFNVKTGKCGGSAPTHEVRLVTPSPHSCKGEYSREPGLCLDQSSSSRCGADFSCARSRVMGHDAESLLPACGDECEVAAEALGGRGACRTRDGPGRHDGSPTPPSSTELATDKFADLEAGITALAASRRPGAPRIERSARATSFMIRRQGALLRQRRRHSRPPPAQTAAARPPGSNRSASTTASGAPSRRRWLADAALARPRDAHRRRRRRFQVAATQPPCRRSRRR